MSVEVMSVKGFAPQAVTVTEALPSQSLWHPASLLRWRPLSQLRSRQALL
jgi:hypothetical protein